VNKSTLKTRAFQEACVSSVVEELAEHLAQWSYSVPFFELSFIPATRLRSFCKSTKIERFQKQMRKLIRQVCILYSSCALLLYMGLSVLGWEDCCINGLIYCDVYK
jgi:hypothetical protein